MKKLLFVTGMLVVMLTGCMTTAERAAERARREAALEQALSTRQLTISVRSMNTQRYGTHQVTPDFRLKISRDTVDSYLPYFGRAWSAGYGSDAQGLHFTAPMVDYRQVRLKRDVTRMEFCAKSREDVYCFTVDVYPNGQASIIVRARDRDNISFEGECDL